MKSFTSTLAVVAVAILVMSSIALARPPHHKGRGRGPPGQKVCYLESNGKVLKDRECRGDDTCGTPFTILYNNTDAEASFCEGQQSVCEGQQDITESRPLPHGACLVERQDGSPEDEYPCREGDECTRCPTLLCIEGVEAVVTFCGRPKHHGSREEDNSPEDEEEDGRPGPDEDRPALPFGFRKPRGQKRRRN